MNYFCTGPKYLIQVGLAGDRPFDPEPVQRLCGKRIVVADIEFLRVSIGGLIRDQRGYGHRQILVRQRRLEGL